MIEVTYKQLPFQVDKEKTKAIYKQIQPDSLFVFDRFKDEKVKSYLENRKEIFAGELLQFLDSCGIDIEKDNEFYTTQDGDINIIHVWFDFVGKALNGDIDYSDFYENRLGAVNVNFRNGQHARRPEFNNWETTRIEIDIVKNAL